MKKCIAFFALLLTLALCLLPAAASADDSGTCGDNLTWSFNAATGKLTITGSGRMYSHGWGSQNFYPWGSMCEQITSVDLPGGLTNIGAGAFDSCKNLKSITIPSSVTSIDSYAFSRCTGLTSVTFPNSVISIGSGAFQDCSGLISINIPASVTTIDGGAFIGCTALTSFQVAQGNKHFTSVNGVLFSYDKKELIHYPAEKTNTSYAVPNGVATIGKYAFYTCVHLTSLTLPDSLLSIDWYAFARCTGIAAITIPSDVSSISETAFTDTTGLTSIQVAQGNKNYVSVDGVLYSADKKQLLAYPAGRRDASFTVPKGVTAIGKYAFYGSKHLQSVIMPNGVASIGESAFAYCENLASVNIPVGVKEIEYAVFDECRSLTSIVIPEGVTKIGSSAFWDCSGLKSVAIPKSVVVIAELSFYRCYNLKDVYYAGSPKLRKKIYIDPSTMGGAYFQLDHATWHYAEEDQPSDPVVITKQPQDVEAKVGETAIFTVTATGAETYQWYHRSDPSAKWVRIAYAQQLTLEIYLDKDSACDGYQYACDIKNDDGKKVTTRIATLTLKRQLPVITTQPKDATVNSGQKATFTVKASHVKTYQWYYRTSPMVKWTKIKSGTKASLSVKATKDNNGYQYACDIKNSDGKVTTKVVTLHVTLKLPVIRTQPKNVKVKSGATAQFTVKASGAKSHQWYYRTSPTAKWTKASGGTKSTLKVKAKYAMNGYQYACDIKNADGKTTTEVATLTVTPVLPTITAQPKDAKVKQKAKVTFTVKAKNAASFQWYCRKDASSPWTKIAGATKNSYKFTATAAKNGYQFACDIKNADGKVTTKIVTLTVK